MTYTGESLVGQDGKIRRYQVISEDISPFVSRTLLAFSESGNGLHYTHVGEPGSGKFLLYRTVILGAVWSGIAAIGVEKKRYHHLQRLPGVLSLNRGDHGSNMDPIDPNTNEYIPQWHFVYDVQLVNLKDLLREKKIAFCLFGDRGASTKTQFNKDLAAEEQNYLDKDPRYLKSRPSTTKAGVTRNEWKLYRPRLLFAKGPLSDA